MSDESDHDLLISIREQLASLREEFRRAANGVGFPRCGERRVELDQAKADIQTLHGRINKVKALLWGGLVALALQLWTLLKERM